MPKCTHCDAVKGRDEFYADKRLRNGLMSRCKPCHLKFGKVYGKKMRDQWYEYIASILAPVCQSCGYDRCFQALDFHHIDPARKELGIAQWVWKRGFTEDAKKEVAIELENCIVLCANCHREHHAGYSSKAKEQT